MHPSYDTAVAKGTEVGILLLAGIVLILLAGGRGGAGAVATSSESGPIPKVTSRSEGGEPTNSATEIQQKANPSVSSSPGVTSGTSTAAAPAATATSATPANPAVAPWAASVQGMRLIVEGIRTEAGLDQRLVFTIRIENDTKTAVAVPLDQFIVVDDSERSFGIDEQNSSFTFDDLVKSWYPAAPFAAGTVRRGEVVLQEVLPEQDQHIQMRAVIAKKTNSVSKWAYFTIPVEIDLPAP